MTRNARAAVMAAAAMAVAAAVPNVARALSPNVEPNGWPDEGRRNAAVNALTSVINRHNIYGDFGSQSVYAYYNAGIPTAQASYLGSIGYGGTYPNDRVTQHELNHYLGSGTLNAWYDRFDGFGGWTGPNVSKLIQQFEGDGARIYRAGVHFYPYGLNFDSEVTSDAVFMRNVALMYAMRQDMGVGNLNNPWSATAVTLAASDPVGTSAFNWFGGGWSNAGYQGWSDRYFPHAGAAYSTGAFAIRTPQGFPSWTFGGDSLTVNAGGQLLYNGYGTTGVVTVNQLILDGGTVKHDQFPQDLFQLGGNVTVNSASTIDAANGNIRILSNVGGAGSLNFVSGGYTTTFTGHNTFTGNVTIGNATVAAGTGIVGNTAAQIPSNLGDLGTGATRSITVNSGGALALTGGNVLGTGGSTGTLSGLTLVVNPGGVFQTGLNGSGAGWWNKVGALNVNGGTVRVGSGANDTNFQALALIGPVTVGGGAASTIENFAGSNAASNGIHLGQNGAAGQDITFHVPDVTANANADLTIRPKLLNTSANLTASGLTKAGTGTMVLAGANAYTGATNVNVGTLAFTTSQSNIGSVTVANNAGLHVQAAAAASTTLTSTSLTLGTGGSTALTFDFNLLDTTAPVISTGTFTANGTVNVALQNGSVLLSGSHTLVGYTSFAGGGAFTPTAFNLGPRSTANLVNNGTNALVLNVTADRPVWTNLDNNGNWQTGVTGANKNWKLQVAGGATDYLESDNVLFDDTAAGGTAVAVNINAANVSPVATTFNNSTSKNYTVASSGGFGIAGVGSLTKSGTGSLTVSTSNTFTGSVTVNGGTLYANAGNAPNNRAFSYVSGITVNGGATLRSSANALFGWDGTQEKPITVNAGGTLTADGGATGDVGVGTVTLAGGTLASLAASTAWGSWRFDEATDRLLVTENSTVSATNVKFGNAGAAIDVAADKTLSFTGTVTNATSGGTSFLTKTGLGTVVLSGVNTYTGGTTINAGTASIGDDANIGGNGSAVTLNGGTLKTTAFVSNTHPITVGDAGGTINVSTTGQYFFNINNLLRGSGALSLTGTGTLTPNTGNLRLNQGNTYSGALTVGDGGILEYGAGGALGTGASLTIANQGEVAVNTGVSLAHNITVSGGTNSVLSFENGTNGTFAGNIALNANATVGLRNWYDHAGVTGGTITGVISGAGGLTVDSGTGAGGTLTMSALNTFTGNLNVENATLVANASNNAPDPTGSALGNPQVARNINVNSGGTLRFAAGDTFGGATTTAVSTLVVNAGGAVTNAGNNFTTLGPVRLNGGTLTGTGGAVAGYQMYNLRGTVTVGGTSASTISGSGTFSGYHLAAPTAFDVAAGADLTVSATLIDQDATHTGAGSLTKTGLGTMVLSGTNTYTGVTTVNGGTLSVSGSIGSSASNVIAGSSPGTSGILELTGTGTVTGDEVWFANPGSNTTTATGSGTLAGGTTLNSARWTVVGRGGNGASSGTLTLNGGTLNVRTGGPAGNLEVAVFDAVSGTLNVNADSAVNLRSNANILLGAVNTSGNGTVNQNGGAVTFYSDAGTTPGGTGALTLGAGTSSGVYTYHLNGGTLTTPQVNRTGTGGGQGVFNFNGGTLRPTAASAAFMQGLTRANVRDGGAVVDTNGVNVAIPQPLLHSNVGGDNPTDGGLTKAGLGTLTLSGANTYTGPTTVANGTLALTGTGAISSTLVLGSPAGGGTAGVLDITGRTATAFTLASVTGTGTLAAAGKTVTITGTLAPGFSPGTTTVTGDLGLGTNTIMELAGTGGAAGTDHDFVNVGGNLAYGGALAVTSFGGHDLAQAGTYDLFDFATFGGDFASVTVGGNPLTNADGVWGGTFGGTTYTFTDGTGVLAVVPEPASLGLLAAGVAGLLARRRRGP